MEKYAHFPDDNPFALLESCQDTSFVPEQTERPSVPEYDNIVLEKRYRVGDGFVRLVDYMGNENSVVRAARVSYGAGSKGYEKDKGLLYYLLSHEHTTPFEQVNLAFHVGCPMFVWRQWIRQRTASVNEISGRYVELPDNVQRVPKASWRLQSESSKQGSSSEFLTEEKGEELSLLQDYANAQARRCYQKALGLNVAKEQARTMLPLSTMTAAYWEIDLHNLLRWLSLRQDSHAQEEIRVFANVIAAIVAVGFPRIWEAHCRYDHRKDAVKLTQDQLNWLLAEAVREGRFGFGNCPTREINLDNYKSEKTVAASIWEDFKSGLIS